jgi:hypothetical protein
MLRATQPYAAPPPRRRRENVPRRAKVSQVDTGSGECPRGPPPSFPIAAASAAIRAALRYLDIITNADSETLLI